MKQSTKLGLKLAGVVGAATYVGTLLGGLAAYQIAMHVSDAQKQRGQERSRAENTEIENFWYLKQPKQQWMIQSFDGLNLVATYIPNPKTVGRLAILAHGLGHSREQMIPYARIFMSLGYDVLMPDARAFGDSQGHTIGYGWLDRLDYERWITMALDQLGLDIDIVLMGISMGAATVMATSGEPLPDNVKAIVEDSGYADLYDEAKFRLTHKFHLPAYPIMPVANRLAHVRAGYGFKDGRILQRVMAGGLPILMIHGSKDQTVPVRNAHTLYDQLPQQKGLYIDPDARHVEAIRTHPDRYQEVLDEFLHEQVGLD
ncbi:alpha/beta hydrolase [Lactiplantibacillus paraplantarum]|uniref:Hydrolase n=1 Tax=Lactiplantibacillus paraplantarum TaxID=60520 RepID=A0AAD0TMH1_9LACO|nr:alpha/beta hydrolase [Lactiplantibacillus paraplantarum]AVW09402.1 alpha/beta hydrolase [Lactiplantibacillus paraplantarum]AYJ37669.1 alpha/beta hydrolase [Lactiplantibacillus paraplantarum]ERL43641.1 putative cell surface hydrolase, membrane-bound (putative) [Lactiplantibacillus paraplantarum]KRL50951.1 family S9 peptidase [Lactiplantibacillus paraplantarum DSM 10667]MCU4682620.1 alpha/beta hydrolase [Lactiplantibacillus paraplantarum]